MAIGSNSIQLSIWLAVFSLTRNAESTRKCHIAFKRSGFCLISLTPQRYIIMAGDWIPMRLDLSDDPSVISIAVELGIDEFGVVGRLHRLWSWANTHLVDGRARVPETWIDRFLSTPGFTAALINAGWLVQRSAYVEFPHFERWNSQCAKQRILATKRKNKSRCGRDKMSH